MCLNSFPIAMTLIDVPITLSRVVLIRSIRSDTHAAVSCFLLWGKVFFMTNCDVRVPF